MFLGKIWGNSVITREKVIVHGMVYIRKGMACFMSKAILRALGCLPDKFPEVERFTHPNSNIAAGTNSVGKGTS